MNLTNFYPEMRGNVVNKSNSQHRICRQNIKHQKFL